MGVAVHRHGESGRLLYLERIVRMSNLVKRVAELFPEKLESPCYNCLRVKESRCNQVFRAVGITDPCEDFEQMLIPRITDLGKALEAYRKHKSEDIHVRITTRFKVY